MDDNENTIDSNKSLKVADLMKREVAKLDNYETRQEIVSFLKDQFIAERMEASSTQEKARVKVLEKIMARVDEPGLPFQQLLKAYEIINKGNDADIAGILGGGAKGGVNLQINNNNSTQSGPSNEQSRLIDQEQYNNPIKEVGQVIESIRMISKDEENQEAFRNLKKTLDDE